MDPLTHTLFGAALSQTRPARRTAMAVPTLLLAANFPDVDGIAFFIDSDLSLAVRRGWTHGVLAMAVLPFVVTAAVLAWDRWMRRPGPEDPPVLPGRILALSFLGVLSHPLLDFLNTYGVRFLMPFDGRWYYGDALYIVDPWLWLILGGGLFLICSRSRLGCVGWGILAVLTSLITLDPGNPGPDLARWIWAGGLLTLASLRAGGVVSRLGWSRQRVASWTVGLGLLYALAALSVSWAGSRFVQAELPRLGFEQVEEVMVGPMPGNPMAWDVVAVLPEEYRVGRLQWRPAPRLRLKERPVERTPPDRIVSAALEAPCVRGMVGWMRFPFFEVERHERGYAVYILDARYVRRRLVGFGGSVVHLDLHLRPVDPRREISPRR